MTKTLTYLLAGVAGVALLGFGVYLLFSNPTQELTVAQVQTLGSGEEVYRAGDVQSEGESAVQSPQSISKVFKITDGPVAGATLLQTHHPTTTLARFVLQTTGHVLEVPLDSPGAISRAVSNTTIPGVVRALWTPWGDALLQYLDGETVKTLHLQTSTSTQATRIQFLPNDLIDVALSPNGTQAAYLLPRAGGADGYVARSDGSAARQLFSVPLSQVLLSWPSATTMLLQSKPRAGIVGMAFSVDARSGSVVPLLSGLGLTATADKAFGMVVYQTNNGADRFTFAHAVQKGEGRPLSFDPLPEKCVWGQTSSTTLYCAALLTLEPAGQVDLWRMGVGSTAESIFAFGVDAGGARLVATPGSSDGGIPSDVAEIMVSPDDHYVLFIKRGDRSLWGIRL